MSKKKKFKFDLLAEDLTMGSTSQNFIGGQTGQGSGQTKPQAMSIMDLIDAQQTLKDKQDNAPGQLPYPVSHSTLQRFADAYFAIQDVKNTLRRTVDNPLISSDDNKKEAVMKMYDKCLKLQKLIELCGNDLDTLSP
jgi:hypothetical protein